MKLLPAFSAVVLASLSTTFALTETDLAPASLAGKTMTFTVEYGAAPFATDGSWTGTFESTPANGFTIKKITGATADSNSTQAFKESGFGVYTYTITPFIAGQKPGSLSLWIADGIGHYEIAITDLFGTSQGGTFTIGAPVVSGPDISVLQGKSVLADGGSRKNLGTAQVTKSISKIFTVKNSGNRALKAIAITLDGRNKGEFTVSNLGKTQLAAKESTTFKLTFKPKTFGVRNAALHLTSNDKDESPFDIKLTGTGVGIK